MKFLSFFSILVSHICPPGSGSSRPKLMRIRMHKTGANTSVFRHAADAEHEPRAPAPPPHVLRPALHHDSEHRPQEARLASTPSEILVFEIRIWIHKRTKPFQK